MTAEADKLGRQLAKAKRRLVTVDDDMVQTVQDGIRRLDAQHQAALVRLRVVEKPASQLQAEQDAQVDKAMKLFSDLRKAFKAADQVRLRKLLRLLIDKVELWAEKRRVAGRKRYVLTKVSLHIKTENLSTIWS